MNNTTTIIAGLLSAVLLVGCSTTEIRKGKDPGLVIDPPVEPMEYVTVGALEIQMDTRTLVLNPNAELPIKFMVYTEEEMEEPQPQGLYYYHGVDEPRIEVFANFGTRNLYAVLIHEFLHHVEVTAAKAGWDYESRIKLASLIHRVLEDINDPEAGFETHTHERPIHWFTPTKAERANDD